MTAILHAHAEDEARAYLARTKSDEAVDQRDDGLYFAVARIPHPADATMTMRRTGSGYQRDGALELARLELRGALARYFADPAAGLAALNRSRESIIYSPGEASLTRVVRAMVARGLDPPRMPAIHGAYIELGAGNGLTVGDLVEKLIERRHHDGHGQGMLLPAPDPGRRA